MSTIKYAIRYIDNDGPIQRTPLFAIVTADKLDKYKALAKEQIPQGSFKWVSTMRWN